MKYLSASTFTLLFLTILSSLSSANSYQMNLINTPSTKTFEQIFNLPTSLNADLIYIPCRFNSNENTECKFDTGAPFANYAKRSYELPLHATGSNISFTKDLSHYERSGLSGGSSPCLRTFQTSIEFAGKIQVIQKPYTIAQCLQGTDENLVGLSVVEKKILQMSFSQSQFTWLDQAPKARLKWEPIDRSGVPFLRIDMKFGAIPTQAVFDTGANITIVSEEFVQANPQEFEMVKVPGKENADNLTIRSGKEESLAVVHIRKGIPYLEIVDTSGKAFEVTFYRVKSDIQFGSSKALIQGHYVVVHSFKDFRGAFGPSVEVVLGNNHITQVDWIFDLQQNTWTIPNGK